MGAMGPMGLMGLMGTPGATGAAGSTGATGPAGPSSQPGINAGSTASAQVSFSGYTAAHDGNLGGRTGAHAICAAAFAGSHFCTNWEVDAGRAAADHDLRLGRHRQLEPDLALLPRLVLDERHRLVRRLDQQLREREGR